MDPDTRFTLFAAPICGALGSFCERLVTHIEAITKLAANEQYNFMQGRLVEFLLYSTIASIVTTAGMLLFPINLQARRQAIGTALVFGMLWPTVMDRLLKAVDVTLAGV